MIDKLIEKPLHVGKTDSYSLTVSSALLNGEAILTADVTCDPAKATVGASSIDDNVILVYLTGVESVSYTDLHFEYTTATRSDCDTPRIAVEDC